jgi:hypothetical protein
MDRKEFLKKGLLGTGFFVTSAALSLRANECKQKMSAPGK